MTSIHEAHMVESLRRLGYEVIEPPPAPRPDRCSVCGAVEERVVNNPKKWDLTGIIINADLYIAEWLTPIKVEVGDAGQEGWDYVTLFFCEEHDGLIVEAIQKLGFVTHHHGSTHPLADLDCPGDLSIKDCPVTKGVYTTPYDEDEYDD